MISEIKFQQILSIWYNQYKRDLPWRKTNNPYFIWISEIVLQQTRVNQGLDYYNNLIKHFPDIETLANSNLDHLLKLWQGLGYYSRARNLHSAANYILHHLNGEFPKSYLTLLQLKGIGEYSAAAIASFAYNEPVAVVDGNVYRVLARIFGIKTDINSSIAKKEFKELAMKLIDIHSPGLFNQAIIEFGALQCIPKNPKCSICPFVKYCFASNHQKVNSLPVKSKKVKIKTRFFHYFIIQSGKSIFINQRQKGDIWQGLYEFPLIETDKKMNINTLIKNDAFKSVVDFKEKPTKISTIIKHILTHQVLYITFYHFNCKSYNNQHFIKINMNDLNKYAVPIVIEKYLSAL
jgi:A/G-specific adenine glycosylase